MSTVAKTPAEIDAIASRYDVEKIRQDFPVEGAAHFLRPPFHLRVIVCKLSNVEADARKEPPRVSVGQRSQGRQTLRKSKGSLEGTTPAFAIKGLGQGALIPAS